ATAPVSSPGLTRRSRLGEHAAYLSWITGSRAARGPVMTAELVLAEIPHVAEKQVDVMAVQIAVAVARHLRLQFLVPLAIVLDLDEAFVLPQRALHAGERVELVAFDVHLDDDRLARDHVVIVEAHLADLEGHLARRLLRHGNGRFPAVALPAFIERD